MRARVGGLTASLLLGALLLLALDRSDRSPGTTSPAPTRASASPPPAPDVPRHPAPSRDIFQYADGGAVDSAEERPPALVEDRSLDEGEPPASSAGPRLVGVLRRAGAAAAALAVDGDVVLLAPGQSAAGVTVVAIEGDSVRVRTADGREITLVPPE